MIALWLLAAATPPVTFDISGGRAKPCPAQAPGDVVVCARTARENIIPFEINDVRGRLIVEPGGPRQPVCDPGFAARAGLVDEEGDEPVAIGRIGPERVLGRSGRFRVTIDGVADTKRVSWPARPFLTEADCWAGPAALPQPIVRFLLGPPVSGGRTVALPEYDEHHGSRDSATDAKLTVGRVPMMVRFDGLNPRTALTAPAALVLARAGAVRLDGPVIDTGIYYGMRRPIRRLVTAAPLRIGPLTIATLYARVSDYADASAVQSLDPSEFAADDIVASGPRQRIEGTMIVRVGSDDLARCQSITFDGRKHRIMLTC